MVFTSEKLVLLGSPHSRLTMYGTKSTKCIHYMPPYQLHIIRNTVQTNDKAINKVYVTKTLIKYYC